MKRYLISVTERVGSSPEAIAKAKEMFPHLEISPMTTIRQERLQLFAGTDAEACEKAKVLMSRALENSEYSMEILETVETPKLWVRGQWI